MNVVISNKYREELKNIGIEISGVLEGSFNSFQIVSAFRNYYYERIILDITAIKDYNNISILISELKNIFSILDPSKTILFIENTPEFNNDAIKKYLIDLKIYNFAFDINEIIELYNNKREYEEVKDFNNKTINNKSRIIGIKNVTDNAGATTLTYMMMKELSKKYSVKCLEIDKNDFKYFEDQNMKSINSNAFINEISSEPFPDVILVDQNNYENDLIIKETIFLVEPSIVKLNKALDLNPNLINSLRDKKVVFNRTSVSLPKLMLLQDQYNLKVFDIIRNVNEKDKINPQVINLLTKLGFDKANNGNILSDDTEKKRTFF